MALIPCDAEGEGMGLQSRERERERERERGNTEGEEVGFERNEIEADVSRPCDPLLPKVVAQRYKRPPPAKREGTTTVE